MIYEQNDEMDYVEGSYSIEVTEDGIYLSMNTPISWLLDKNRQYPVVIDPNIYVTLDVNKRGYAYHYYYWYQSGTWQANNPPRITNYYYF